MEPQQPASDDSMTTTPTPDDLALMRDLAEDRDSSPGEAAQIDQLMLARAVDQIKDVEATLDRYRKALEKCCRLSGADLSDGFPTWPPLDEFAVQEVGRLRADYDEACDDLRP